MGTKQSSLLRVPVDMPDRSGHNLSHSNAITGTTGTLIPVLCEELLPNDTISLGAQLQVQLPPMVTDFYGKVDFVLEAFFVPNRLLWGGWQDFITHPTNSPQYPEGTPVQAKPTSTPKLSGVGNILPSTLTHYLDYGQSYPTNVVLSPLPLLAYHRIWDDWYRDTRIQSPLFYRPATSPATSTGNTNTNLRSMPYFSSGSFVSGVSEPLVVKPDNTFADGVRLDSLRQRNWVKDYFTASAPLPQAGGASEVKLTIDSANNTGALSIADLRAANSLQKWLERNNLAGYRYSDQIYAQFGITPADAIMDRPLYLGRHVQTVYNRSVFSTVAASEDTGGVLATKGASSQVLGEGSIINKFTASEHGYIMVLASLVPRPVYSTGISRRNVRTKVGDFAFPLLAGMGEQEIKGYELSGDYDDDYAFGYTDQYAEYKFRNDMIHGLMRDGYLANLQSYALQRSFYDIYGSTSANPRLGSDFLLIPTDYLDQVQAIKTSTQGYTYWADIYFPFKKISTIPAYSQPTLADLKNSHTEYISRGGKRL